MAPGSGDGGSGGLVQIVVHRARWQQLAARGWTDLSAWLTRRPVAGPGQTAIGHSAELRMIVFLLVGSEVLVEGLLDVSVLPPAWRPFHLLWIALMIDASLLFAASTRRNPHLLTADTLRLSAGLFDQLTIPLRDVAGVRRERVTAKGRGIRVLPGHEQSLLCTVAGTAELVVELRAAVPLRLADGSVTEVRRFHLAVDDPVAAHRELLRAVASG
ncbi:hypothetical protein [Streptacidiphilus sp. P02-A3a]|uniref:hypothetical protein n=1 Tax=Streptacidiphilus sp. P02-A3a TaxID=2704468 RepID=UPI0015F8E128|nr:hypothetical protein [Streptacidiphilus sp. P02-A3a]QMU70972.1 hypothetical protein GXP74_24870 [Streptacidiphilus sp. P02-A3a]